MQRLLAQIGRTQRLGIINQLKRNGGMTVTQLATALTMSYMGIKQHCIELEKDGYLDTWRQQKGVGRPELLYRLTKKANDLFPGADNSFSLSLLEQAKELFGTSAAEKLLYLHFQKKIVIYKAQLRGESLADRVKGLTRMRDREGGMADLVGSEKGFQIVERHNPLADLFEAYPSAAGMEREMMEKVLGVKVSRTVTMNGGFYECVFSIG